MTEHDDGEASATTVDERPVPSPSDAALARYARRMRPLRIIYAAAIAVVLAVAAVIVVIAYQRGEISHVTLRTVAEAPPSVPLKTPTPPLSSAWSSTDTTAIGAPYYRGTVVTHDEHTVRGRNARTGRPTWSYTRTDRAVCTAIQTQGVTIAVYRLHGNCDELTALDTGTGQRKWTRTLDKDGAEFNGPATYSVLDGNVMFMSATSIYSLSPNGDADHGNGGLDYWTFHHPGCTIHSAVLGSAGALISQTCSGQDCGTTKFCGNGEQLLLRDPTAGYDDDSKTNGNNPDRITWNHLGSDLVPTSAGQVVAARSPGGGELHVFDAKTGKAGVTLPLVGDSGAAAPSAVASTTDADLIWIGGRTYALRSGSRRFAWRAATVAVPTVTGSVALAPGLEDAELSVPTRRGIALLDPADGTPTTSFTVPAPAPGSLAYPLGSGFLVAGPRTAVYG